MHSKALDKIQKLLALAERAGTPEEADTAFAQAQRLMTAHAISEAQVRAAGSQAGYTADEPIVSRWVWTSPNSQSPTWLSILAGVICEVNGCALIIRRDRRNDALGFVAWGTDAALTVCEALIRAIGGQVDALAKRSGFKGRTALNNFRLGAAQRVCERLREAHAAQIAETRSLAAAAPAAEQAVTALALRNVEGALALSERKMRADCPRIRSATSSASAYDASARSAGRAAGSRVNLAASKGLRS